MQERSVLQLRILKISWQKPTQKPTVFLINSSKFFHACSSDQSLLEQYPQLLCNVPSAICQSTQVENNAMEHNA